MCATWAELAFFVTHTARSYGVFGGGVMYRWVIDRAKGCVWEGRGVLFFAHKATTIDFFKKSFFRTESSVARQRIAHPTRYEIGLARNISAPVSKPARMRNGRK